MYYHLCAFEMTQVALSVPHCFIIYIFISHVCEIYSFVFFSNFVHLIISMHDSDILIIFYSFFDFKHLSYTMSPEK